MMTIIVALKNEYELISITSQYKQFWTINDSLLSIVIWGWNMLVIVINLPFLVGVNVSYNYGRSHEVRLVSRYQALLTITNYNATILYQPCFKL